MWRASCLIALALIAQPITASIFSEGGKVGQSNVEYGNYPADDQYEEQLREIYEQRLAEEEESLQEQLALEQQMRLQQILEQMELEKQAEEKPGLRPQYPVVDSEVDPAHQNDELEIELQNTENRLKEQVPNKEEEMPELSPPQNGQPTAQKKGQSEYVSFVEPVDSARTKDIPILEKRRLAQSSNNQTYQPKGDANLLMMAIGCVLVVGTVGGAIGGGIYYRKRKESPDDSEYAPYAGTGPYKKGKKGDKGDENMAYKAQLHHYQQAKQKIICGDDVPGVGLESDEEEGADDENNFSVYECPGLAPTGDIEVHNPNFAQQP